MAIIRPGAVIGAISGKSGGAVYTTGPGSPGVRSLQTRPNPRTPAQEAQRIWYARISAEWRQLTDDERAQWEALAQTLEFPNRLGLNRNLTTRQYFFKYWLPQPVEIFPNPNVPPLNTATPTPLVVNGPNLNPGVSNTVGYTWSPSILPTTSPSRGNVKIKVFSGPFTDEPNPDGPLEEIHFGPDPLDSPSQINLAIAYNPRFGNPTNGSWITSTLQWFQEPGLPSNIITHTGQFIVT